MSLGTLLKGAIAGVAATGAMSIAMVAGERAGLVDKVAPERITDAALDAVGIARPGPVETAATAGSHVAYGTANGVVYAVLAGRFGHAGPMTGALFGAVLFAVSYEGWVPAVGIMPPAHRARAGRVTELVVGHFVYGATLGSVLARLTRR